MKRIALITSACLLALTGCASEPPPVSDKVQAYYDEHVANAKATLGAVSLQVGDFEAAAANLQASKEPFTLTVIGDSTGYAKQGWVEDVAQDIAAKSSRKVDVHTWNLDAGQYDPAHSYGSGGPLLTIWNGSASGRDPSYSMNNMHLLMPERPDLVVVNHGHNMTDNNTLLNLVYRIAADSNHSAVAVTKQNPRAGEGAPAQAAKMAYVTKMVEENPGLALIDAYSAFPDPASAMLSPDQVHPNPQGYRAWANVFLSRVGFSS